MKRRLRGFLTAAVAVGLLAYVVAQLTVAQDEAGDLHVRVSPLNPLIVVDRNSLSICVDGAGGYSADSNDVATVRTALDAGLAKFQNLPSEYASRTGTAGCRPARVPLGRPTTGGSEYAKCVQSPSAHVLFVYLIPAATYAQTLPLAECY